MSADTTDASDGTLGGQGGRRTRRAIAALALVLLVLGATLGAAGTVGIGRTAAAPVTYDRDATDDTTPRRDRRTPVPKKLEFPNDHARSDDRGDAFADRALDRSRDLLDRYGSETIVRAVVVGALVQVLCLLLFRLVGSILRLVARGFAMAVGVVVALALLGGPASLSVSGGEAATWLGRLTDLVERVV